MKIYCFALFLFLVVQLGFSQNPLIHANSAQQKQWVDSVYNSLTVEQKIAQLFIVDVFTEKGERHISSIKNLIEKHQLGGVIFSKGSPHLQAQANNQLQAISTIPLLVTMDAEWGLAMRLDSTYAFPWNMTIGAVKDLKTVERVGYQIGKHNHRLGVHMNFAPVVDLNTNPDNPIIGNRSFGENKNRVAALATAFMNGMHKANVLSNVKHFPGHGDTDQDSHLTLPSIQFSEERIKEIELYPFQQLFKSGTHSVMIAHLDVPSLVAEKDLPTSLSFDVVTKLLKEEMEFEGLIFSDALNMKGVSNFNEPGEVDLMAFKAGVDVMLISKNIPKAIQLFHNAYQEGEITEVRLAHSVKKILQAKYLANLHHEQNKFVDEVNLYEELNEVTNQAIDEEVFAKAITLLKNDMGVLPIQPIKKESLAYVHLGDASGEAFFKALNKFKKVDYLDDQKIASLLPKLSEYDQVIIGHHKSDATPWKNYHFSENDLKLLQAIAKESNVILVNFTSPYALKKINSFISIDAVLQVYQNKEIAQTTAAQSIFGAYSIQGKLPVSIANVFSEGSGLKLNRNSILGYAYPENVGFSQELTSKLDSVANLVIDKEMSPGLQLLVARKGKIVHQKAYGYHTYKKLIPTSNHTIYDLASLTKILASLPLMMQIHEKGDFDFESTLSDLLPNLHGTNKADLKLKNVFSHYAGLQAWIPFFADTIEDFDTYYSSVKTEEHSIQVANNMYIKTTYIDSIYHKIIDSKLESSLEYKYSDLPFYLAKEYIEYYFGGSLKNLVRAHFYEPMNLKNLTYHPLEKFQLSQIAPSEEDLIWRNQLVHGHVHDQGAAMMGGIGGHAGLFGNSEDVAKILYLYLNKGKYSGKQFIQETTIDKFNTCYFCEDEVRRGIVFDKPQLKDSGPTCGCLSLESFGHSGFTGTYAWADPEEEIIYIFLSNRTFPSAENKKLIDENIRTEIQQIIYDSILED
ncbi:glycoside hydrolase family 3 N-terminal domain-containing protein [Psychroflexus maritimus]|uniref:beta-N-acetylhexosaminidase n=1 Tax=Psychroflexus maritimus TaxID=2714865 RepID=A0A967AED7_9FLAO|nr:glycoside hydrolase family 3 N-terminal domain-containing protein [Psychroflexus maritimus]NGZ90717.1 serine hydrolase [Psychroflexus maritimus]